MTSEEIFVTDTFYPAQHVRHGADGHRVLLWGLEGVRVMLGIDDNSTWWEVLFGLMEDSFGGPMVSFGWHAHAGTKEYEDYCADFPSDEVGDWDVTAHGVIWLARCFAILV